MADPDPLHGITQLVTRWAAAFVLDPDGATETTAPGADRMARRLDDGLPDRAHALRSAVWRSCGPCSPPRLAARNADAFLADEGVETTVDLATHRGESTLDDLDFADEDPAAAAA